MRRNPKPNLASLSLPNALNSNFPISLNSSKHKHFIYFLVVDIQSSIPCVLYYNRFRHNWFSITAYKCVNQNPKQLTQCIQIVNCRHVETVTPIIYTLHTCKVQIFFYVFRSNPTLIHNSMEINSIFSKADCWEHWIPSFHLVLPIHANTYSYCQFLFNISLFKYNVFLSDVLSGCSLPRFVKSIIFCLEHPSSSAASVALITLCVTKFRKSDAVRGTIFPIR